MKKRGLFLGLLIVFSLASAAVSAKSFGVKYPMQKLLVTDFEKNQLESCEKRFLIEVQNPNSYDLDSTPVVVKIKDLDVPKDKSLVPGSFFVTDEKVEKVALTQIDDMNEDSIMDEIVFLADIKAKSKAKFYIYYSKGGRVWQFHKRYTDGSALPGWESELYGYRSYSSFILDTFAKPKNNTGLILRMLYDEQLRQLYNHHTESEIGMDTLNVATTSGLAGVVFEVGGKKLQPSDGAMTSKVIVSGPVRTVVSFTKDAMSTPGGKIKIERIATIYAHHFETQVKDIVTISGGNGKGSYGIGLRKDPGDIEYKDMQKDGLFTQWHNQHKSIGEHGIGIYIPAKRIAKVGEDKDDHYVLIKDSTKGSKKIVLDFVAFAAWKGGKFVTNASEFKDFAYYIKNQQGTVKVKIAKTDKLK